MAQASAVLGVPVGNPLYPLLLELVHYSQECRTLLRFANSDKLRGFNTRHLNHEELAEIENLQIDFMYVCSVPLGGMAGMVFDTASHHFAVLVGHKGDVRKRLGGFLAPKFDCTGYIFEFGLASGDAAAAGPSAVSLYAINPITVFDKYKHNSDAYEAELARHSLTVRESYKCSCSLKDAFKLAVELGNRDYTLTEYNCKAYARSLMQSIRFGRAIYETDGGNNKMMKAVATFALGGMGSH